MKTNTAHKGELQRVTEYIRKHDSAVVAFSGGVDSALLAYLTSVRLPKMLAVTIDSPVYSKEDISAAVGFAHEHNIPHKLIGYNHLENETFCDNTGVRCFHCKSALWRLISEVRAAGGYDVIFDGTNFDELTDRRPGLRANTIFGIKSPFVVAKLGKGDIRDISKMLGLSLWDRPSTTCLSSRIPINTKITDERIKLIGAAERIVKMAGYRVVRVRLHGKLARIEVGDAEKIDIHALRNDALPALRALGFQWVTLDLEGYKIGGGINE